MIASRLIPLYFLLALAGCEPPTVDKNRHRPPSAPRVIGERGAPLHVVFVAARTGAQFGTEYVFSVRNTSSTACTIQAVGVLDGLDAPVSCRLLRLSSAPVPPGSYAFAVVQVDGAAPPEASIHVDFQASGATSRIQVPAVPTCRWASNLSFSPGLSTACFCARLPSDRVVAPDQVSSCSINGIAARIVNVGSLPEVGGTRLACVMIRPAQHLQEGEAVVAELQLGGVDRFVYAKKAGVSWFVGKTQYDTLLRVVKMNSTESALQLSLYNESDFFKSPLVIEAVRLDGVDVTSNCELPKDPVPPDFHKYETDVRRLTIRDPWAVADLRDVEIAFHLLEPKYGDSLPDHNRPRTIGFVVKRGMNTVIGHDYDPYLPNCTSIHDGGLRPPVNAAEVARQSKAVADAGGGVPVYATVSSGTEAVRAAEMGAACDFMVISPRSTPRSVGTNSVSETIAFYSRFRESGVPFIASITPDVAGPFSSSDFRWCVLAALCEGSRGFLVRSTPHVNTQLAWSCLPTVESIKDEWRTLSDVISVSEKVGIAARANQPGIHIGTLFCGCDRIILIALNEWCTRSSYQAQEPFYAVPRHGAEIELRLGEGWEYANASDAFSRSAVDARNIGEGRFLLKLPAFEIGRAIVVARDPAAATDARPVSTPKPEAAEPFEPPALMPIESPFVDLGRREAGTTHAIEIPIRNTISKPIAVTVEAIGRSASNPASVEFAPMTIPANADGVLTGNLKVPPSAIPSVTCLRVLPPGSDGPGFNVFIDIDAYDLVKCDPKLVDCGQFTRLDGSSFRTVSIESADAGFRIERVRAIDVPVEVDLAPDGKSFRFRATPQERGSFAGNVEIRVVFPEHGNTIRTLTVPFTGRYAREVEADPQRLLLWNNQQRQSRRIALGHFEKQALSVVRSEGMAPWVHVRSNTAAKRRPVVEVTILPDERPARESLIQFECRTADGAKHFITVPVKVVGVPGTIPSDRIATTENGSSEGTTPANLAQSAGRNSEGAGEDSEDQGETSLGNPKVRTVARQVQELLKRARTGDSPQEMQNWLKVHHLLIFGDNAFLSGSADAKAVLDDVLHPTSSGGLFVIRNGRPFPRRSGDRFDQEHHHDQFLNYLSICGIPTDATMFVDERRFQLRDLLENSLREARTTGELAWTVSAYAYYLEPGRRWSNKFGEPMSLVVLAESLLSEKEGACGGTHQLFAMSRVLSRPELKQDERLASVWPRLERRVSTEMQRLQTTQNPGGDFDVPASLRERLLAQPGATRDRIGIHYTGHCTEWLVLALPPDQLSEPWVLRAVEYLTAAIFANFLDASTLRLEQRYQYGFQSHALSALSRWHARVGTDL